VFDWFGFAGERIEVVRTLPPVRDSAKLTLGTGAPVSLTEARRRLPYRAPLPRLEWLGPPDAVRLRQDRTSRGPVYRLSLLWGKPGAYVLLFTATPRTPALTGQRSRFARKRLGIDLGGRAPYEWTRVHGRRALWIAGPHQYVFTWPPGGFAFRARPAHDVLLWQDERFFFRLEGTLSLVQAVRMAESVR
jgi:hypothetical protein